MRYELAIETILDAPVAAVWRAWREHLAEWWCPLPWTTEVETLDLRAGGKFVAIMIEPEGDRHRGESVFLEVVPERRVVFTNGLAEGFWPHAEEPFAFVGVFEFEPDGDRTRYRGEARHWSAEDRDRHAAFGFEDGWRQVAKQLEAVAQRITA